MTSLTPNSNDKKLMNCVDIEDSSCELKNFPISVSSSLDHLENASASDLAKNTRKVQNESDSTGKKIYSYRTKATYLTLMAIAGSTGPLASCLTIPALDDIAEYFGTDYSRSSLTVTSFLISIAIFPLFWSVLADSYGRKWFSVISMVIFALSSAGCSLSTSIEMLIVLRVFQGLGTSASLVISIGIISDIFPKSEMGRAIGLGSIGILLGPVVGPIIGGYMSQYLGWKSIFYLCAGLGAILAILILLIYKETIDPSIKLPPPIARNSITGKLEFAKTFPNPFGCLLFLKNIDVVLLCVISCIIFVAFFGNEIAQPLTVGKIYQLSASQVGLSFIATGIGNIVGSIVTGFISDYIIKRYTRLNNGKSSPPKLRLYIVLIGSVIVIPALLVIGWFVEYKLPLAVILFSQFLLGLSMSNILGGVLNYLIETFPAKSSSVAACNSTIRLIFAAISTKVTPSILDSIGSGYTFTIYSCLEIISLLIVIFMIFSGSKFSSKNEI
jgi:multidrug resistance protein